MLRRKASVDSPSRCGLTIRIIRASFQCGLSIQVKLVLPSLFDWIDQAVVIWLDWEFNCRETLDFALQFAWILALADAVCQCMIRTHFSIAARIDVRRLMANIFYFLIRMGKVFGFQSGRYKQNGRTHDVDSPNLNLGTRKNTLWGGTDRDVENGKFSWNEIEPKKN